jgi:hypothetical protein
MKRVEDFSVLAIVKEKCTVADVNFSKISQQWQMLARKG